MSATTAIVLSHNAVMGKVMYLMTRLDFLRLVNSFNDSVVKLILNHTIILLESFWLPAESLQQGL